MSAIFGFATSASRSLSSLLLFSRRRRRLRRNYCTLLKFAREPKTSVTVKSDFGRLRVKIELESEAAKFSKTFSSTWLVHNCQCPRCRQEFTGQKLTEAAKLRPFYTLKDMRLERNRLHLTWDETDAHETVIDVADLVKTEKHPATPEGPASFISGEDPVPRLHYDATFEREGFQVLKLLNEYGVCLITDAPLDVESTRRIATTCGPIQSTIYGHMFDVTTTREASSINIAYTDAALPPHMDLAYYESPPGLQFLHCLEFDPPELVEGGTSVVVDAWKTALLFREQCPEHFRSLASIPATFQKIHSRREQPVVMAYKRPHVALDAGGRIVALHWSPSFEGPLDAPDPETAETYYRGYAQFAGLLENSPFKSEFRLRPGEVLCFNNRRMLHARTVVKRRQNGRRHLRGCYVNVDEFKSKLCVLAQKYEPDYRVQHVMNGSHF